MRRTRFIAIPTFVIGLVFLAAGFYISWESSILSEAVAGSTIAIFLTLYSLSRLKIRVEIEKLLLILGLILLFIAMVISAATGIIRPDTISRALTISCAAIITIDAIIITKQKQFYLFVVFIEAVYIVLFADIMDLQLYSISAILLLATLTAILMKIAARHCRRRVNFISLLEEFVIEPVSKALSWLVFTIPFVLISVFTFTTQNIIQLQQLSSLDETIKSVLAVIGAIYATVAVTRKLHRECCADVVLVAVIAMLSVPPLIYTLGILDGWISLSLQRLRDLKSILALSFTFIPLFVHAPMICLLSDKDKCAKFS